MRKPAEQQSCQRPGNVDGWKAQERSVPCQDEHQRSNANPEVHVAVILDPDETRASRAGDVVLHKHDRKGVCDSLKVLRFLD
jgi:hypothetical protein